MPQVMRLNIDKLREDIIEKAFLEVKTFMQNSVIRSQLDDQEHLVQQIESLSLLPTNQMNDSLFEHIGRTASDSVNLSIHGRRPSQMPR